MTKAGRQRSTVQQAQSRVRPEVETGCGWNERVSQRARESDGMKWPSFIAEGQPTNAAQLDTRSPVEGDRESGRGNKRTNVHNTATHVTIKQTSVGLIFTTSKYIEPLIIKCASVNF